MRKSTIILLCLCLVFCFGCKNDNKTKIEAPKELNMNYPYTFTDAVGKEFTLYQEPERVAVLFSSYAEIWQLAGGTVDITVGESIERGFAQKDCILVDSASGHTSIDTEILIASEPDLVIGTADHEIQRQTAELCNENGIPCALFKIESFEDYIEVLKTFTDLLNTSDNFQTYGTSLKTEINTLFNKTESINSQTKILFIRSGSSARSAKAKTSKENFVCTMLNELGTYNIAENASVLLDGLSIEEIITEDPDIIFISTMGNEDAAKEYMNSLLESEQWNSLTAVEEGRYYYLPKEMFHYKPNARWAEAYYYLANLIYPELDLEY